MVWTPEKPPIHGETPDTLAARLAEVGHPRYRAAQILEWVFRRRAEGPEVMTNLPAPLREWLGATFDFAPTVVQGKRVATDVTQKLLQRLRDGSLIETVIIRAPMEGVGQEKSRRTICISTQVGCAFGCRFCASGLDGFKRNLSAGEILSQLIQVCRVEDAVSPERAAQGLASFDNIVVMGMGEPMANYDNLMVALRALNAPWGGGIGARKVTISTSGVVPGIRRLASEPEQFQLAISLHGATDDVRGRIMPVNRKYPIRDLVAACSDYVARRGRMITLEYILIEGVNDDVSMAAPLVAIARQLRAKVNLIPYNAVEGLEWRRPGPEACRAFADAVESGGVTTTLRMEKGHDIDAACGQLRLRTERDLEAGAPTAP